MLGDDTIGGIAAALAAVPGVVGVLLGGSWARRPALRRRRESAARAAGPQELRTPTAGRHARHRLDEVVRTRLFPTPAGRRACTAHRVRRGTQAVTPDRRDRAAARGRRGGRGPAPGLVPHRHRPRAELQPAQEPQIDMPRQPREQRRPVARQPGMHHEPVLVDRLQPRQRQRKPHAAHEQSFPRLPLELPDALFRIPAHELRVPVGPLQGARHDVLLRRVDRPGERLRPIGPRPRRRRQPPRCLRHLVGHPAEEERIGLDEVLGSVTVQLLVRGDRTVVAAPVRRDVDGVPQGSHGAGVPSAGPAEHGSRRSRGDPSTRIHQPVDGRGRSVRYDTSATSCAAARVHDGALPRRGNLRARVDSRARRSTG